LALHGVEWLTTCLSHFVLGTELRRVPEPFWTFQRREKSLAPTGIPNPDRPVHSTVTIPTAPL